MNQRSRYLLSIAFVMIMIGVSLFSVHKARGNPSGSAESGEATGIDRGPAPIPHIPDSLIRHVVAFLCAQNVDVYAKRNIPFISWSSQRLPFLDIEGGDRAWI